MLVRIAVFLLCLFRLTSALAAGSECVRATSGTDDFKGEAAIVFFHFGDDKWTTLAQETLDLSLAFKGMDYKVLLMDEDQSDFTNILKGKALDQADEVLFPTQDNFLNALQDVADKGYVLNIWIIAHGSSYVDDDGTRIGYFKTIDKEYLSAKDLYNNFGEGCELPIRMVYSVSCSHSKMIGAWADIGAKAAMGARSLNFYPNQYTKFAKEWAKGTSFGTALDRSNTSTSRTVVQAYLATLGLSYSGEGECGLIPNVLGENDCAEWFFTGGGPYDMGSNYNSSYSGKWNMNRGSDVLTEGDGTVTRSKRLEWDI